MCCVLNCRRDKMIVSEAKRAKTKINAVCGMVSCRLSFYVKLNEWTCWQRQTVTYTPTNIGHVSDADMDVIRKD